MKEIKNERFGLERALYGANSLKLINCSFDGIEDGESALKEASCLVVENCYFNLRYPLWHDFDVTLNNIVMTENCRAALWYSRNVNIFNSKLLGIKALRECHNIKINDTTIDSEEFGWRCSNINLFNVDIKQSEYLFFESKKMYLNKVNFKGKYSFQYVNDMTIINSYLDTKDAFWHSSNIVVKDSTIKGEYLAWYSNNITFINCKIIGTQPFCYCKNIKLIDCEMIDTDLAFEYSNIKANIIGEIESVKNPKSGYIIADNIKEVIITKDSKCKCLAKITIRGKKEEKVE